AHEIETLVKARADFRDMPAVRARLQEWANCGQVHRVYEPEVYEQFRKGDIQAVLDVLEQARALNRPPYQPLIDVFKNPGLAFPEREDNLLTLALPTLLTWLNDGGPCRGEALQYFGRTNVGKSTLMANDAVASAKQGQKTVFISFENSVELTWKK